MLRPRRMRCGRCLPIIRLWRGVTGYGLISTKTRSAARRAFWSACGRSVQKSLRDIPNARRWRAEVAESLGFAPGELLLTNGVDEAIHLLCQTYLESGDEAIIVVPTYSMYRIYAMAAGAQVISIPAGADFIFPANRLKECITPRTRLIAIANPNNPTGTVATQEELVDIARSAPNAAVLIDEAYFEFYGKTLLGAWRQFQNVFVARTFSKVYGMAGLRLGMLVGDVEQMRAVRRVQFAV